MLDDFYPLNFKPAKYKVMCTSDELMWDSFTYTLVICKIITSNKIVPVVI